MPLTADTITDEQIRDARRRGWITESLLRSAIPDAANAFAGEIGVVVARARCAEILNAREPVKLINSELAHLPPLMTPEEAKLIYADLLRGDEEDEDK